jgi:hypothetical protein
MRSGDKTAGSRGAHAPAAVRFHTVLALAAVGMSMGLPGAARAGVEEVRVGVLAHNIRVTDPKNANKEDGVDVGGELVFGSPDLLSGLASPRPYVALSVNTAGETSYAGVGLIWQWRFAKGWRVEPGFGYVLHSGEKLDNPVPRDQPARRQAFEDAYLLLGSRDLFRTSIAVTREVSQRWAVQAVFEHLSHGQILGSGRNQGLDMAGVRVVYRFAQ